MLSTIFVPSAVHVVITAASPVGVTGHDSYPVASQSLRERIANRDRAEVFPMFGITVVILLNTAQSVGYFPLRWSGGPHAYRPGYVPSGP